jgi:diaminopimelate decarboxylase
VHAHIGSQIFLLHSFAKEVEALAGFVAGLAPEHRQELCVGGGLGVAYVEGEESPPMDQWAATVKRACKDHGIPADTALTAEPGRAIAAQAAITLYTVGTVKHLPGIRTYIAVDGGMSDNPRPVLYGSGYEAFLPRATTAERPTKATIVGKHCESGDVIVRDARLPADIEIGDIVATPVTGAYGHSMASNYNKVPRPAVLFVKDGEARTVVRRETLDDLLRLDAGL